jgi:soluble lytic murein transglycosylase
VLSITFLSAANTVRPLSLETVSALNQQGKPKQALEILSKITDPPSVLIPPLINLKARLYLLTKDIVTAAAVLRSFVDTNKLKESGQLKACEILAGIEFKEKNYKKCAILIESLLNMFPHHRNRYELKFMMAEALSKEGQNDKSLQAFLELGESRLQKLPARLAYEKLFKLFVNDGFPPNLQLSEKIRWGYLLLRKREYSKVLDVITPLINSLAKTNYSKAEIFEIYKLGGNAELARGNGWWAAHLFKNAAKYAPTDTKNAEVILLAGDSMYRLAQYERASKHYKNVLNNHNKISSAAKAAYGLANIAKQDNKPSDVITYYKQIISSWPDSWFANKVAWELGLEYYRQKKFKVAADSFRTFTEVASGDRLIPAASYWHAKSLSHLNSPEATRQALKSVLHWPTPGIYHLSAAHYLSEKGASFPKGLPLKDFDKRKNHIDSLRTFVPGRPSENWVDPEEGIDELDIERISLLKMYNFTELLIDELERLVYLKKNNTVLRNNLAWAYNVASDYPGAIEQGERMIQSTVPFAKLDKGRLFDKLFPLPDSLPFRKYSVQYDVEPFLTYSIAREESHFDKGLISWAGAKGLMQIMNPTGRWIAPKIGITKFEPELLYKEDINIKAGCWYLDHLLKKFSDYPNKTILAMASYNGGPGNMGKWLKKLPDKKQFCMAEFMEEWPLEETRNYVRKVGRSIICYELLNKSDAGSSTGK